jgi:hypothetical protein
MMYKTIILLIIPIIFNTIIGMIKHNAENNKTSIEELSLIITYKDDQLYMQSRENTIAIDNYETNKANWIKAYNICDTTTAIDIIKHSPVILYIRAITVSIFLLSWTVYILILMKYLHFKYLLYKYIRIKTKL